MKKITQTEAAIIKTTIANKVALHQYITTNMAPSKEKTRILAIIEGAMDKYYFNLIEGLEETI